MMKPISIILPVYNCDQFITRSLNSISNQTFRNWECIIVNDGSYDNTRLIIENFALKDCRFRIFNKKNEGVATARQFGLDKAEGEYIISVDGDDWLELNFLEELYNIAKLNDADLVWCNYYKNSIKIENYAPEFPSELIRYMFCKGLWGSTCNKLIRATICKDNRISFPLGLKVAEDIVYVVECLCLCKKIKYCSEFLYHYINNPKSLVNTYSDYTSEFVKAVIILEEFFKRNYFEYYEELNSLKLNISLKYISNRMNFNPQKYKSIFPEVTKNIDVKKIQGDNFISYKYISFLIWNDMIKLSYLLVVLNDYMFFIYKFLKKKYYLYKKNK